MSVEQLLRRQLHFTKRFAVSFVSIVVALYGIFIVANTLLAQIADRHGSLLTAVAIDLPLIIGLGLVYLSAQLYRRKRTAWLVAFMATAFYLGINVSAALMTFHTHQHDWLLWIRAVLLPMAVLGLLYVSQQEFVVRSDLPSFRVAARLSVIMLLVAFVYGVAGFTLLDKSDFHEEVSISSAAYYTTNQFELNSNDQVHAYTRRGHLFLGSLMLVSVTAIVYIVLALFSPLRLRLSDQRHQRQRMLELLTKYPALSEEFFKLWPHDKLYYFDEKQHSGVAFHVRHGIALCLGDPAGDPRAFNKLLKNFRDLCYGNDWRPAFIHVTDEYQQLYSRHGFSMQKIGEEAVVTLEPFLTTTVRNKYFRHINNKFTKQGYTCELLVPPHSSEVLARLRAISQDWLSVGGRAERGFAMGHYGSEYMQLCSLMVARDETGAIQAFLNQLPASFDMHEAGFDLLRHTKGSPGNLNDFLLIKFMQQLQADGYQRLNLGLCPLVGLDDEETQPGKKNSVDGLLRFAYANGSRFYSFSGLYRFKSKYEPEWRNRYVAYRGGVQGFSRTMNALMRTMRVRG